jgi:hypothetical protein
MNVDFLKRAFNTRVEVDTCNYKLKFGIEKLYRIFWQNVWLIPPPLFEPKKCSRFPFFLKSGFSSEMLNLLCHPLYNYA